MPSLIASQLVAQHVGLRGERGVVAARSPPRATQQREQATRCRASRRACAPSSADASRVTSTCRLSPVSGSASVTATGLWRSRVRSAANCRGRSGKRPLRGGIRRAAREHAVERALRLDGDLRSERDVGGTTPSRITVRVRVREAAQVVLRDARAVGAAVEIDAARSRAPRAPRRGRAPRCWSCRTAAVPGSFARHSRASAASCAGVISPRLARRPGSRSRADSSRPCRADPRARGRARGARARSTGSERRVDLDRALPGPPASRKSGSGPCAGRDGGHDGDGELDARARRRRPGLRRTESRPQRASVEVSPSRSAMRQGSSAIAASPRARRVRAARRARTRRSARRANGRGQS